MDIEITTRKECPVEDEVLFGLFQRSFQQWHDQGIEAKFLSQDIEYFRNATKRAVVILAMRGKMLDGRCEMEDAVEGCEPVGMLCINRYKDKHAYDFYLTVAPEAKHQGVGTRMLDYAVEHLKERGYKYLIDTTSVQATWSIRWHLKNGYRIVGFGKGHKPYCDSYKFRKQIAPSLLWSGPLAPLTAKSCYLFWRAVRLLTQRSSDGEYRWMMDDVRRLVKRWMR